jgi:hypothetical protein
MAVREGVRAVRRSKRLIALSAIIDLLVGLPAALYVFLSVHASAGHHELATEQARELDPELFADLRHANPDFDATLTGLVVVALVLYFIVQPLIRGGYVGIAAHGERRLQFAEFVREGGATYWKFLRVALVGAVLTYLLSLAAKPLLDYMDELAARLGDESSVLSYRRLTELFVFGAFLTLATILDYTRVGIGMYRRPGVLPEVGRSTVFLVQQPFTSALFAAIALLAELGAVWAMTPVLERADGAYVLTSGVMLALLLSVLILREAARLFHLAGAWALRVAAEGEAPAVHPPAPPREPDLLDDLPWHSGEPG